MWAYVIVSLAMGNRQGQWVTFLSIVLFLPRVHIVESLLKNVRQRLFLQLEKLVSFFLSLSN